MARCAPTPLRRDRLTEAADTFCDEVAERAVVPREIPQSVDEIVVHRTQELTAYQDAAYAARYKTLLNKVKQAEASNAQGMEGLTETVARYAHKLMAYKDEYEVARLYTDGRFRNQLDAAFEGDFKLQFHLAPPLFTKINPETGLRDKTTYGAWMLPAMKLLAKMKGLRGTMLDPFGYSTERKTERRMIGEYEAMVEEILSGLTHGNHALAVEIASLPEGLRGYGHVKERHFAEVDAEKDRFPRSWLFHHRWGRDQEARTAAGHRVEFLTVAGRTTAWVPERQA